MIALLSRFLSPYCFRSPPVRAIGIRTEVLRRTDDPMTPSMSFCGWARTRAFGKSGRRGVDGPHRRKAYTCEEAYSSL